MTHASDIVAYTFNADTYCPDCIIGRVTVNPGDTHHSDPRKRDNVEALLDSLARIQGIDRTDERTYDSGDFPKVVFADQVWGNEEDEYCGSCGEIIEPRDNLDTESSVSRQHFIDTGRYLTFEQVENDAREGVVGHD